MKIGITERGDASINYSWVDKLDTRQVAGAILITKNLTDEFIDKVKNRNDVIVHCTCTGHGGTVMEPHVSNYKHQLEQLNKLLECGFPRTRCVLRVDPIIPTDDGFDKARNVIEYSLSLGLLPDMRVRVSVLDEYNHVKQRLQEHGYKPLYGGSLYASRNVMQRVNKFLCEYSDITFETCAEPFLGADNVMHSGCVSAIDIVESGVNTDEHLAVNPQKRSGCLCLSCKQELLDSKRRCKNGCLYCYWRD